MALQKGFQRLVKCEANENCARILKDHNERVQSPLGLANG
jgi:hypothetical protein